MSLYALTRSIFLVTSLLTGLGQSVDALAHGVAHAHEAEHGRAGAHREPHPEPHAHEPQDQHPPELLQPEFTPPDHQHDHLHAIVDTGLKSRADLVPSPVARSTALALLVRIAVPNETPHAANAAARPERRHTSASPRAPPSR